MNPPANANARNLIAACAAITVFGFAFGMSYPLLSLILEARGVSSDLIGINSAMMPIGILLFSPVIPVLAKRFGARNLAIVAAIVTALVILSYRVFDSFSAWFLIRLLQGMSISTLFVLSEAWIVGSTGDHNRGKIVAIYASVLSGSFGAGPLLVLMGTTGYGVYTVSLVALGNRFSGIELINGSASFALVWGFGALLGSISGGMAMLASGLYGLPFSLALVYLILALGVGWRQISLGRLQVKS